MKYVGLCLKYNTCLNKHFTGKDHSKDIICNGKKCTLLKTEMHVSEMMT